MGPSHGLCRHVTPSTERHLHIRYSYTPSRTQTRYLGFRAALRTRLARLVKSCRIYLYQALLFFHTPSLGTYNPFFIPSSVLFVIPHSLILIHHSHYITYFIILHLLSLYIYISFTVPNMLPSSVTFITFFS